MDNYKNFNFENSAFISISHAVFKINQINILNSYNEFHANTIYADRRDNNTQLQIHIPNVLKHNINFFKKLAHENERLNLKFSEDCVNFIALGFFYIMYYEFQKQDNYIYNNLIVYFNGHNTIPNLIKKEPEKAVVVKVKRCKRKLIF
jgi:hypothetical protein